jgi:hypothetical protein
MRAAWTLFSAVFLFSTGYASAQSVSPATPVDGHTAAILANSAACTAALAQQRVPIAQQRDEAPIGHVQPRTQDLPPGVAQMEDQTLTELDDIAKKLDMIQKRICPGC